MPKYDVMITETVEYYITVEADSPEDAEEDALAEFLDGQHENAPLAVTDRMVQADKAEG